MAYRTYKTHEIIREFKLCMKDLKKQHKLIEYKYYEYITELLIREAKGESVGLLKYFEDFLPTCSKDYFKFIYDTHNPVRNIVYWRYQQNGN